VIKKYFIFFVITNQSVKGKKLPKLFDPFIL